MVLVERKTPACVTLVERPTGSSPAVVHWALGVRPQSADKAIPTAAITIPLVHQIEQDGGSVQIDAGAEAALAGVREPNPAAEVL